ncbi:MAG: MotA/TolQ/ExbB proton channel family protein [Deltaproteobacteria bacterium]|nr:MotA/TolQ/ExbB proton channel family protein [Deltaproteobacteria bacterium]
MPPVEQHDIFGLIAQSDAVIKFTLALLLFFSVVSWAIIAKKWVQLKEARRKTAQFLTGFWGAKTIEGFITKTSFRRSPALGIFKAGLGGLKDPNPGNNHLAHVQRQIQRGTEEAIEEMEGFVPFLATTASAAPFIGLFGTVWGILSAFWKIGREGSSSLAVVGPDIAEALIATAIGLAAAIPAVIFYNFFVNKIRVLSRDIQQFADDPAHRIEREYFSR